MQVLSPSRRALGGAALLSAGALLGAPEQSRAQVPTPTPPAITMTLDSPLARSATDALAPSPGDRSLNSGTDREGIQARPLSIVSRFGRWFPVAVNLTNIGPDAQATLSMRLWDSDPSRSASTSSYQTRVDLPSGSSKRVWIYGRMERGGLDAGQVTLSGGGVGSLSRTFALSSPDPDARVVWTLSSNGAPISALTSMSQLRAKSSNANSYNNYASSGRPVESPGATPDLIPEKWVGLDSVDAVVLRNLDALQSVPKQNIEVLRAYIAAGGSLIVLGGDAAESPLRDILPVQTSSADEASLEQKKVISSLLAKEISYSKYLQRLKNAGQGAARSEPSTIRGPLSMTSADELRGLFVPIWVNENTTKARALVPGISPEMVSSQRFGAGRVVWVAFDPSSEVLQEWRGQEAWWKLLLNNAEAPRRIEGVDSALAVPGAGERSSYSYSTGNDSLLASLRAALSRSPQLRTPAASSIAWFLALYVFFLVPVNYIVLRFVDRRELAWVTVPVIVLAFSSLSYAAAVRIKGTDLRTRQVAIVQGSDASPMARADSMLWVFSPRKASYSIEARGSQGEGDASMASGVYADGRRSDALDSSQISQGGAQGFSIQDSPIQMWDYKSFVGQSVVPSSGGFEMVEASGRNVRFLTNKSGHDLKAAAWIENGRVYSLGDLRSGAKVEVPLSGEASSQGGISALAQMAAPVYNFDSAGTGSSIASAALSAAGVDASKHADGKYPAPTLVAWQGQPATGLAIKGGGPVRESVALWVWRFTK